MQLSPGTSRRAHSYQAIVSAGTPNQTFCTTLSSEFAGQCRVQSVSPIHTNRIVLRVVEGEESDAQDNEFQSVGELGRKTH